jgi:VWFA-related protein
VSHSLARRFAVPAFFSVAAAVLAAQAGDQAPAQAEKVPQQPPIRVEANFVRVDAYPTVDGKPVMDLKAEDFEILEDHKPQKISTFEHVIVRANVPQEMRAEPNTIEASKQLAANPRNRVFIVFLDTGHVEIASSWRIREPLIRLIDKILSPDDLIGIMTPRMSAQDIVLARKTQVMASGLRDIWPWGTRDSMMRDEREQLYLQCFASTPSEVAAGNQESPLAREMGLRRRERITLEALTDLVRYMHSIREERKAIVTVTEGWVLYGPNTAVTTPRVTNPFTGETEPPPMPPPPHVDPFGRLTVRETAPFVDSTVCDAERMQLANIDDWQYMLDLIGEANRANATFYTIDPRGLAAFDTSIGPEAPPSLTVDRALLRSRLNSTRMLAENTDGLSVQDTNDLDKGLRRISDDLSAYYLIGYYSTNTKLDGRFRNLTVRVKRPGVNVRARRGYRAATAEEVRSARAAAEAPVAPTTASAKSAIASLSRIRFDSKVLVNAAAVRVANGTTVWVAGELASTPGANPAAAGATANVEVSGDGESGSAQVTLAPGQRAFLTPVTLRSSGSGPIDVRVRVSGADRTVPPLVDSLRLDPTSGSSQALLFRRGLSTGNRLQPAADARFSRTERAHVEIATPTGATPGEGRLLDKEGQPVAVPVTIAERSDEQTGQRWITADLTLAPLAPGDYAIEIGVVANGAQEKMVTAIRVVK